MGQNPLVPNCISLPSFILVKMAFIILGENGLVSRFNSGDLAGKCAASNRQQKIALRAENPARPSIA